MFILWDSLAIIVMTFVGLFAAVLHEVGHIVAARVVGVKVKKLGLSWKGMYIVRDTGTDMQNAIISLSGPMVSLLLMLAFLPFRHELLLGIFFTSNAFMVGLNVLPIPVSDGYRVWKCFERMIHADKRKCKI